MLRTASRQASAHTWHCTHWLAVVQVVCWSSHQAVEGHYNWVLNCTSGQITLQKLPTTYHQPAGEHDPSQPAYLLQQQVDQSLFLSTSQRHVKAIKNRRIGALNGVVAHQTKHCAGGQ
jgi:hypothetical protein